MKIRMLVRCLHAGFFLLSLQQFWCIRKWLVLLWKAPAPPPPCPGFVNCWVNTSPPKVGQQWLCPAFPWRQPGCVTWKVQSICISDVFTPACTYTWLWSVCRRRLSLARVFNSASTSCDRCESGFTKEPIPWFSFTRAETSFYRTILLCWPRGPQVQTKQKSLIVQAKLPLLETPTWSQGSSAPQVLDDPLCPSCFSVRWCHSGRLRLSSATRESTSTPEMKNKSVSFIFE